MTTHTGYLLIADISGYTAYLTSSEMDHANPILRSLLSVLVEQVGEPLHLWRMEGDAVLAYSTHEGFPSGETFLEICENLYNSFARRRQDIVANTTCQCRACANVASLDLKILAHHGSFDQMKIGPMTDISGADVILVHRMSKTDVKEKTGIRSYALFSDAAVEAMGIERALVPYSQSFEHFGEIGMKVYDLAKAWEAFRENDAHFLREADGVYTFRYQLDHPPPVVWQALVAPELKTRWMDRVSDVTVERPQGRIGPGSGYHCVHEEMAFQYWITDWWPFSYFSTRIRHPARPELSNRETYELIPNEAGCEVRYTMAELVDEEGKRHPDEEKGLVEFLSAFWQDSFDKLAKLLANPA